MKDNWDLNERVREMKKLNAAENVMPQVPGIEHFQYNAVTPKRFVLVQHDQGNRSEVFGRVLDAADFKLVQEVLKFVGVAEDCEFVEVK